MSTTLRWIVPFVLCGCISSSSPPPASPGPSPSGAPEPAVAAPDPGCGAIAGAWELGGSCGDDDCTIVQSACTITQVWCHSGSRSDSGSIDGGSFTYTGASGAGVPATCSGTIAGDSITGTCTVANAATCTFSGTRN